MKSNVFALLFLTFLVAVFVSQCAASDVKITTKSVPNGTVDTEYSATIKASGGCTPYKWKVSSGKLPAGVTQKASSNSESLDLSGDPKTAETYSFTESVSACDGSEIAYASFKVVVQAAPNHVVDLKWQESKSNDVAGYNVYRGPNGETWTKINSGLVVNPDYDDSTVANGTTYYYAATTVNTSGEESKKSTSVKVSVPE
jgi:hypothetical protein